MKNLLLASLAVLMLSLTACKDKKEKNPFEGTKWINTTYLEGSTTELTFESLTCRLSFIPQGVQGIEYGQNYTYTYSGKTASLTPLGESVASHKAIISGSYLYITNLTNQTAITFSRE